jgi:hypothetical protein
MDGLININLHSHKSIHKNTVSHFDIAIERQSRANAVYMFANKSNCEKFKQKKLASAILGNKLLHFKKIDDADIFDGKCAAKSIKRLSELQNHVLFLFFFRVAEEESANGKKRASNQLL